MDWSKAKNVLIVAFIVTNIFLIYNIKIETFKGNEVKPVNDEYLLNVEEYLNRNDIYLNTDIPEEIISLPVLLVKYKNFDSNKIAGRFLGKGYDKTTDLTGRENLKREIFKKDNKEVIIEGNKRLIYKNIDGSQGNHSLNEKTVTKISNDFLKQYKLMKEGIVLDQIYYGIEEEVHSQPIYKLIYNQTYKNKFLGESYIHVYVNNKGVVAAEAMLLEYEKTQYQQKKIIPAAEALMRAMNTMLKENETPIYIKEIEAGYYFSPTNYIKSDWKDIDAGTAFPSWKITIQNGKAYYIEAYKS